MFPQLRVAHRQWHWGSGHEGDLTYPNSFPKLISIMVAFQELRVPQIVDTGGRLWEVGELDAKSAEKMLSIPIKETRKQMKDAYSL